MAKRTILKTWLVISIFLVVLGGPATVAGKTIYVDDDVAGANDGSSWADAYKYLQDALADANSVDKPVEIRVAQGIYRPDRNTAEPNGTGDRTATFQLINGVTLRGAYAGFVETDPNGRDIERYETILSGDLMGNDVDVNDLSDLLDELTRAENSYHVVTGSGMDETAVLDGFTITAGNANHSTWHPMVDDPDNRGAGMYNANGSPWVTNCTFRANSAEGEGGGMCNWGISSPTVTICTVTRNVAMSGGGMYNMSNPTLTNCTFSGNWGRDGGGGMMNVGNNPTLTDCTFSKNTGSNGGGMWNADSRLVLAKCKFSGNTGSWGGGMKNYESSPTLTNCTFIGNSAEDYGGGIYNDVYNKLTLTNCTFIGNSAEDYGGGICNDAYNNLTFTNCTFSGNSAPKGNALVCKSSSHQQYPSNLQVSNCILWDGSNEIWNGDGSAIAIRYSDVQGGETVVYDPCDGLVWGDGNIDAEPRFVEPNNGDYHLKSQAGRWDPNSQSWVQDAVTSPCIDAGDMASPIGFEPFPNGGVINMGAYGGTAEASKSWFGKPVCEMLTPGDLNGDCVVDQLDMAIIAFHWLEDAVGGGEPTSALAYPGPDGELVYATYRNVGDDRSLNILPDWSKCGYMGGGVKIPDIPVQTIVNPMDGDDGARIQAAIDYVSSLPPNHDGFRGTVLLTKGTYDVEEKIFIRASGIVLRGQGQSPYGGTRIIDTGQQQDTLISVEGGSRTEFPGTRTRITESFVPVGAKSFRVQSATGFSVGDHIIVHRQTNQKWIDDLGMAQYWNNRSYYEDKWERVITAIDGDRVAIDAPIVQAIEEQYGGGSIFKCSSERRISNVGVECLWLESEYDFDEDETHGWNAVELANVENAWVRQITSQYFGYACVNTMRGAKNVTIQDCACLDPKSKTTGGRKYSFPIDDCCFVLIQRCFTRGGRHDYITGSRVPGPNAFIDCLATECYADSGNHHRYAEGTLFDNVKAEELAVENRQSSGTGHGWSGAQTLFWNCEAATKCHAPHGAMNWAIGVIGKMQLGSWAPDEALGYWEAHGTHVTPRSLYYKQLEGRLGPEAVANVTIPAQRTGTIWNQLSAWAGVGRMEGVPPSADDNLTEQAQAPQDRIAVEDRGVGADGFAYVRKDTGKSWFSGPVCELPHQRIAGDINEDCKVDFKDFAIMALHWLE